MGQAYVVVYDVTDAKTFADAATHIQGVKTRHGPTFVAVILVGNKKDLHDKRVVTTEEGLALAAQHHIGFIETSALTGMPRWLDPPPPVCVRVCSHAFLTWADGQERT
jgi:GTPase SAR1 family protein